MFLVRQIAIICLLHCSLLLLLGFANADTTQPWYEDLPSVAMDYKIHVDPGKEECYYQYVNSGATFYVSFQVIRGGDRKAGFAVTNPAGQLVQPYEWRTSADYEDRDVTGGYYSICIDNHFSRFTGKLINLYLTVIRYDQWEKFTQELEDLQISVENATNILMGVEKNINEMLQIQHLSRSREGRDLNLLVENNQHIPRWSVIQIIIIVASSSMQVYFVRKLFQVGSSGYTKVRI